METPADLIKTWHETYDGLVDFLDKMYDKLGEAYHQYYLYRNAEEIESEKAHDDFRRTLEEVVSMAKTPIKDEGFYFHGIWSGVVSSSYMRDQVLAQVDERLFHVCYNVESYLANGGEHPDAQRKKKICPFPPALIDQSGFPIHDRGTALQLYGKEFMEEYEK
ncbi:hypothetical protein GOV03_04045 [Candidatus Woesearchaeota archaeon]|nr:hypothetical protein [Candidatus Woesearchaeota archaeon]